MRWVMWRRYRSTVVVGLLAATILGALCGLSGSLGGSGGGRASFMGLGAALGLGTGLAAIVGGVVAVAGRDRRFARSSAFRIRLGTGGASIGAALFWVGLGVLFASDSWFGFFFVFMFLGIAIVAAATAAIAARVLLARVERRHVGAVGEPVRGSATGV